MNRLSEAASRVRPELADTLLAANSSDKPIRCRSGLLRPANCIEPLKHCAFRSRQTRIGCAPGPSTMNRSPSEIAALTAAICVSPPITEMRWALACLGGSGKTSPIKRSSRNLMLVVVFSVLLTYVSQPNRRCAFFTWNFLKSDGEAPGRIVEKEMCVGAKSIVDSHEVLSRAPAHPVTNQFVFGNRRRAGLEHSNQTASLQRTNGSLHGGFR